MNIRTIEFDDETQTLWYVFKNIHTGKADVRRIKVHIECPKEYFKRKLKGK